MNTFGAIPGIQTFYTLSLSLFPLSLSSLFPLSFVPRILFQKNIHSINPFFQFAGFLGVYLAGHILELTQSWSAVFSTAALINTIGWIAFTVFGSSQKII